MNISPLKAERSARHRVHITECTSRTKPQFPPHKVLSVIALERQIGEYYVGENAVYFEKDTEHMMHDLIKIQSF
jgi:hypothetical protein